MWTGVWNLPLIMVNDSMCRLGCIELEIGGVNQVASETSEDYGASMAGYLRVYLRASLCMYFVPVLV